MLSSWVEVIDIEFDTVHFCRAERVVEYQLSCLRPQAFVPPGRAEKDAEVAGAIKFTPLLQYDDLPEALVGLQINGGETVTLIFASLVPASFVILKLFGCLARFFTRAR